MNHPIMIIARLTFREAMRRKIVLAALILGLAFLVIYDLGFYFISSEFAREMMDPGAPGFGRQMEQVQAQAHNFLMLAGMYVINFLVIAIGALITADSLAGEIQSGTIQATVTKPISRMAVVLGKWLGNAFLLLLYLLLMGGGVLISIRLISGYEAPNWLPGMALLYFNGLLMMTLTLAFSSSLSTLATGGAVFGAYGLAFIGGWVERIGTVLENETAVNLGIVSSLLLPSEAIWNKASLVMTNALANLMGVTPFTSGSEPSPLMLAYAALYLLGMLWIAVRRFSQRDL